MEGGGGAPWSGGGGKGITFLPITRAGWEEKIAYVHCSCPWQVEQQQQFDEQEKRCLRPTDKAYPRQYCKHIAATFANLAKLLQDEPALFLNLVGMRHTDFLAAAPAPAPAAAPASSSGAADVIDLCDSD